MQLPCACPAFLTFRWCNAEMEPGAPVLDQEMKPCIKGGGAESRKNLGPKPHEATMCVSGYLDCHMEKVHFSIGVSHCGIFIGAAKNHS